MARAILLFVLTIAALVGGPLPAASATAASPAAAPQKSNRLGLTVSVLPPAQRKALGVKFGLVVEAVEPAADVGQIRRGDVIAAINNVEFSSVEQFNEIVDKQKPGGNVALLVKRGDASLFIAADVVRGR